MKLYAIAVILLVSWLSLTEYSQAQSASATIPITVRLIRRDDVTQRPPTLRATSRTEGTLHISAPAATSPGATPFIRVKAPYDAYSYRLRFIPGSGSGPSTTITLVTVHFW